MSGLKSLLSILSIISKSYESTSRLINVKSLGTLEFLNINSTLSGVTFLFNKWTLLKLL